MSLNLNSGASLRHYRIVRLLGRGGMGEVYAADDTRLGRRVAIKILPASIAQDPERLRRFTQEANAASALNHPSILTIYDVDEVDGHPLLVSEFIEGRTLRERLREGDLTLREAVDIAGQIANALAAAHAAGIVHRDVKPENIMLREDGHAKLVDFGLAKIDREASTLPTDETVAAVALQTTPGIVMGTTQYMSPEQARGLKVDARSDIFSLGVVLYEMATGRPPFHGDTPSDVIAAILRLDPPAIADAPPELAHVLHKALEKDRDERHQTAKDLAADLKRLRRRLDPSAETSRSTAIPGTSAWTQTPKSGEAHAQAASTSRTASTVSKIVWLFVGAIAALTVIGFIAMAGLIGLARWLGDDGDRNNEPVAGGFEKELAIDIVQGITGVSELAMSDDGRLLAFVTGSEGRRAISLRQMATGSIVPVAGSGPGEVANLQFTPDGDFLFYTTRPAPTRAVLMAIPSFGGPSRQVLEGQFGQVAFSPDGKRFAVVRTTDAASELQVANLDGTGLGTIETRPAKTPFSAPAWSSSADRLAVVVTELAAGGTAARLRVVELDGVVVEDARTITPTGLSPVEMSGLAWSADNDVLFASATLEAGTPAQLIAVRRSDGLATRLTNDANVYSDVVFSRSSQTLVAVRRQPSGASEIVLLKPKAE
jgi:serine/threonine protein kinase